MIKLTPSPANGTIVEVSPGRELVFNDGRWQTHRNTIPNEVTRVNLSRPPIEQDTPPALPNTNPFWFKTSTAVMHYQYNDGDSTQWVAI